MKLLPLIALITCTGMIETLAQENEAVASVNNTYVPIIENGQTQINPSFKDPDLWIRHDLWVETEFDQTETANRTACMCP